MAEVTYCNTTTDLQSIEPNIDSYDSKRTLTGFVSLSSYCYYKDNVGNIDTLFMDGRKAVVGTVDDALYTTTTQTISDEPDVGTNYSSFNVDSATGFKKSDILLIDSEQMLLTDISSSRFTVRRGFNGTTVAGHTNGETVYQHYSFDNQTEYLYSESDDMVVFYDTEDSVIEAGQDWDTYKTRVVAEASEFVRSYIARPILKRKDSASSRDYDMVLIKGTAYLACSMIILPYNFEKAQQLEWKAINTEDESGILDRLKRGDYKLWNEVSEEKREGKVLKTSTEGSTSDIVDVRGKATVSWDIIKVMITSAGTNTLTHGEDSTATYSTWVKSSDGLQTSQVYNNQTVTGGYDTIGHGIQVRWSEGDLVEDEIWEVEVSADAIDHPKIRKISLSRK